MKFGFQHLAWFFGGLSAMPVQCWGCNGFTYWRRHWGCQNPWCWYTNEDAQKEAFVDGNGKGGKTKVFAQNRKARKGRCFILDNQNDWAPLEDDDVADKPKADKGQGSADKQDADKGQGSADKPKADKAKKKMKKKKRKGDAALRVAKR